MGIKGMGGEERRERMSSQVPFVLVKLLYAILFLLFNRQKQNSQVFFFYSHAEFPSLVADKKKPSSSSKLKR